MVFTKSFKFENCSCCCSSAWNIAAHESNLPTDVVNGHHSLDEAMHVSTAILTTFFKVLRDYNVLLEGIVLKTSMSVAGKNANIASGPQDVAKATLVALSRSVPPAVPGVAFLSGGQTEEQVSVRNNMGKIFSQARLLKNSMTDKIDKNDKHDYKHYKVDHLHSCTSGWSTKHCQINEL